MTAISPVAALVGSALLSKTASANFEMGIDAARHLLNRSGFGASMAEIKSIAKLSPQAAISQLISSAKSVDSPPLPLWRSEAIMPVADQNQLEPDVRRGRRQINIRRKSELQLWQTEQVLQSERPLAQRMVMFWHNLFSCPIPDVPEPRQYCDHIDLVRKHALGNYREFLQEMLRDPALVQAHDAHLNMRLRSNKRFARTLCEHMTLGPGVATEKDIDELTKALTGISLSHEDGSYQYNAEQHIPGEKVVFGQRDEFEPVDAADLILSHPQNARWVVTALWKTFVNNNPEPRAIHELAQAFSDDYEIAPLLEKLMNQPAFWSQANRGALVKTPLDLIISVSRLFGQNLLSTEECFDICKRLGMEVFNPEKPSGHREYLDWLTADTLPLRQRLVRRLTRAVEALDSSVYRWSEDTQLLELVSLPLAPRSEIASDDVQTKLSHYLGDPAFELK